MKHKFKLISALFLIVAIMLSFCACDMDVDTDTNTFEKNNNAETTISRPYADSTTYTSDTNDKNTDCTVEISETTDTFETNDSGKSEDDVVFSIDEIEFTNDTWKMTYMDCQIKNELGYYMVADDGKEFVIVFFKIENITEEVQIFSVFDASFYFDDVKKSQTLGASIIDDSYQLFTLSVDPGKKANGYFLFETSTDWEKWDFIYDDDILHEDEENVIKFTLTKNAE